MRSVSYGAASLKRPRDQCNAATEALRRVNVTDARIILIGIALSHGAYPCTEPVQV